MSRLEWIVAFGFAFVALFLRSIDTRLSNIERHLGKLSQDEITTQPDGSYTLAVVYLWLIGAAAIVVVALLSWAAFSFLYGVFTKK
jgi:hypothetical protein